MANAPSQASAPGKAILLGEHAVVYGQPAIAVPVSQVRATASVEPAPSGSGLTVVALDTGESVTLSAAPAGNPLAAAARLVLNHAGASQPDAILTISSTVPIAGGLGSGAAVSTALVRALAGFLGVPLQPDQVSELVFEVEKLHHGTPSGIDNTVVAHEQPVYFVSGRPPERLAVGARLNLLIADTGTPSSTKRVVGDVRKAWQSGPARHDALFDQIGEAVNSGRRALEAGDLAELGALMDLNQGLLDTLGVSCDELDRLVEAARFADALGAKLSGAGRGGNMIALVEEELVEQVGQALSEAGATKVIHTTVEPGC
jgi:mevalonate kinase